MKKVSKASLRSTLLPAVSCALASFAQAQETPVVTPSEAPAALQAPAESSFDSKAASLETRLKALDSIDLAPIGLGLVPGLTASVPTAYTLPSRTLVLGVGYQERLRTSQTSDGGVGAVVGLLPSSSPIGLNAGVSIFSLRGRSDGKSFGSRGAFNFKASYLLGNSSSVALGVENAFSWGNNDTETSYYGVYSKALTLNSDFDRPFSNLYLNAGLGSGRFLDEDDFQAGKNGINIFGSATTNLMSRLNGFIEWNGQDANVGLSWVPLKKVPLVITPALVDLTGSAGDGTRLTLSAGYSLTF